MLFQWTFRKINIDLNIFIINIFAKILCIKNRSSYRSNIQNTFKTRLFNILTLLQLISWNLIRSNTILRDDTRIIIFNKFKWILTFGVFVKILNYFFKLEVVFRFLLRFVFYYTYKLNIILLFIFGRVFRNFGQFFWQQKFF